MSEASGDKKVESKGPSALCLSGGGIRSAAFSLGVIQALARHRALAKFNYLSTVSGGGYIGSWLTNRIHRADRPRQVLAELRDEGVLGEVLEALEEVVLGGVRKELLLRLSRQERLEATLEGSRKARAKESIRLLAALAEKDRRMQVGDGCEESQGRRVTGALLALVQGGRLEEFLSELDNGRAGRLCDEILRSEGRLRVQEELGREGRAETGPDKLLHDLRRYSRFLTPQPGFWSLDTWRLIGTYLRNLLLGWAVLMPGVLAAVALVKMTPLLLATWATALGWGGTEKAAELYFILFVPALLSAVLLLEACVLALRWKLTSGGRLDFGKRSASWLRFLVGWLIVTAIVIRAAEIREAMWSALVAVGSGLLMVAASYLGIGAEGTSARSGGLRRTVLALTMRIAGIAFMVAVMTSIAVLNERALEWLGKGLEWLGRDGLPAWGGYLSIVAVGLVVYLGFSAFVDVNNYSLHKVYKERLIEAFLLRGPRASLGSGRDSMLADLSEHRTKKHGVDPVKEERRRLAPRLFHVLNATVNSSEVSVDRRGLPFTFTPLTHGFWDEESRPHFRTNENTPLTLGWAMAISGAAANPNMGYFSSSLVRFPMALLNLRLGWWLPHPCSDEAWRAPVFKRESTKSAGGNQQALQAALANPVAAWRIWTAEFLGTMRHRCPLSDERKASCGERKLPPLNLSDGGHFDNLGLYEMVRRGCRHVIAVDASADPNRRFRDLANAIRRIRIDFGVDIRVNALEPVAAGASSTSPGFQIYKGTIVYGDDPKENGTLVYVKPELSGDEPGDVLGYHASQPLFPHESTLDQSFSEAQFESYRALGEFTILRAIDFYDADKGIARSPRLDASEKVVDVLAESAYRLSRGAEWPTLAGGLLFEEHSDEKVSFILVRSSDNRLLVLPKGYIEAGESTEEAARREVEQETGWAAGRWEPFTIDSFERDGRQERVAYFLMDLRRAKRKDAGRGFEERERVKICLQRNEHTMWEMKGIEDGAEDPEKELPEGLIEILERAAQAVVSRPTLAGGVPYEQVSNDRVRFTLVRSSDDRQWVLPKGHIDGGESPSEAAIREVAEETGYGRCEPGPFEDHCFERGDRKERVAYFLMNVKEVEWEPARAPEGREHIEVPAIRRGNAWEVDSGEHELLGDVRSILEAAAEVVTARGASEDARPG